MSNRKNIKRKSQVIEEEKGIPSPIDSKTSGKSLAVRKDVVYKTLIRSLKRYITEKCDLSINKNWTSKADKELAYFSEIDHVYKLLYHDKMSINRANRDLKVIVHDRILIRNDESIKLDPENIKIYL